MEAKAIQATRAKLNVLAESHNKLTTLVVLLLTEIQHLKEDMDNVKEMLDGVEVVSNEEESKPKVSQQQVQQQRVQPQQQVQQQRMMSMPSPPQQPVQQSKSSSRSRAGGRNSSLAELHADDIIKQLTMNSD